MKTTIKFLNALLIAVVTAFSARAQQPSIQNFRPYDKHGLNIYETSKNDSVPFDGLKVRLGISSAFQFQDLKHENFINTDTLLGGYTLIDLSGPAGKPDGVDDRTLIKLSNGFNL